jgi:hypothetical protein
MVYTLVAITSTDMTPLLAGVYFGGHHSNRKDSITYGVHFDGHHINRQEPTTVHFDGHHLNRQI